MKKTLIIQIFIFILLIGIVNAIGAAPSKQEVFFESKLQKDMSFRILNNEHKAMNVILQVRGSLKEYVEIPKGAIKLNPEEFEKTVNFKLNLPSSLKPGLHEVEILVIESGGDSDSIVVANIGVIHKVTVRVPFPDEYVEGILFVSEARPNEQVTFTVSLSNLGTKKINDIKGELIITGPDRQGVARIKTTDLELSPKQKGKVTGNWIASVDPGSYNVQAVVEYDNGKILIIDKNFDVGTPLIDIEDLKVGSFKLGTIAKFDISVRSKWNKDIAGVFGETEIRDDDGLVIDNQKTSTTDLPPLGLKELSTFWDTTGINPGEFLISVKINYFGRVREKVYEMTVEPDKITIRDPLITGQVTGPSTDTPGLFSSNTNIIIIIAVLLFILLLVKFILDYKVKMKKIEK